MCERRARQRRAWGGDGELVLSIFMPNAHIAINMSGPDSQHGRQSTQLHRGLVAVACPLAEPWHLVGTA